MAAPPTDRRVPRATVFAVVVWGLLLCWVTALAPEMLARPLLAAKHFAWLLLPSLLLPALPFLLTLPFRRARAAGRATAAVLLGLEGLLWFPVTGFGAWALDGPYDLVLWQSGPTDDGFRRANPGLALSTFPHDGIVRDAQGRSAQIEPLDRQGATLQFEPCGDIGPQTFGGLDPDPRLRCELRVRLRYRDKPDLVLYKLVFRQDERGVRGGAAHLEAWAKARGAEFVTSGGGSATRFRLSLGERRWRVEEYKGRYGFVHMIAAGGAPPD